MTAAGGRRLPVALAVGLLAAIAVAVAATWSAPDTETSPIYPDGAWRGFYQGAVIASFALYLAAIWRVRTRGMPLRLAAAAAVAIQLLPLAAPLLLTKDLYLYWDYGRIGAIHGGNPFTDPPSAFPDDPAFARLGAQWLEMTPPYGPLWVGVSEGVAALVRDSVHGAIWTFKVLGALGALALVAAVAAAAPHQRAFAVVLVGWSPLVALQFAGGAHHDALMMALPITGLALAAFGRRELGGAAWVLGILIKWLPVILLPLVWARDRLRFGWRGFSAALGVAVAVARYGIDWVGAASPVSGQLQRASSTSVPYHLEELTGIPQRRVTMGLMLLFAGAYLWLLRDAARTGRARLGLAAGLFCLTISWLPPWYAVWPLSLAAIEDDRAARWLALIVSAWLLRDAIPLT